MEIEKNVPMPIIPSHDDYNFDEFLIGEEMLFEDKDEFHLAQQSAQKFMYEHNRRVLTRYDIAFCTKWDKDNEVGIILKYDKLAGCPEGFHTRKFPFGDMEAGDSIPFSNYEIFEKWSQASSAYATRHKDIGIKFMRRWDIRTSTGRIWRSA